MLGHLLCRHAAEEAEQARGIGDLQVDKARAGGKSVDLERAQVLVDAVPDVSKSIYR